MKLSLDLTQRGRNATSPWQMPPVAWKDVALRVWNESWIDNIGLVAAGVAFYGFLALVPLLGILVLTYGLFANPATVVAHVMAMLRILPPDVVELIGLLLMNAVDTSEQTSGIGIVVALAVALYAGGNGAGAIMTALNIAYEEEEKRNLGHFYAIAFTITIAGVLLALVSLAGLERQTAKDSTTGSSLPLGLRGAWAADRVAGVTDDGTTQGPSLGEAGPPSPAEEPVKQQEAAAAPRPVGSAPPAASRTRGPRSGGSARG